MTMKKTCWLASLFVISALTVRANDDWPQWRFNANRSGATENTGPETAHLQWSLNLAYPDPAYDHQYRMCADVTYAPVAAEGLVFIPSSVGDQMMACDLATGTVKWRHTAEGPVRFAPVWRTGRVYFGSDDGYLYCVSAQDGKLAWKIRGVPESLPDSRMLINGRLCSRWPVRGAPVEHDGVIYFGAGIWPEEGVYVCAVNADTGRILWRRDSLSYVKNGMSDHGRAYDLSLPPQGYLAWIDGKLAVPSGRSLAAWFDPTSGTMEPYTCFYAKNNPPRGTWYLSGINRYWVQGGNWFGTRPDAAPPLPATLQKAKSALYWSVQTPTNELYVVKQRPFLNADTYVVHNENFYSEPVLTPTVSYASEFADEDKYDVARGHTRVTFPEFDRIVARDLTRPKWTSLSARHFGEAKKNVTMPRLEYPIVWQLPSKLRVLIKAADRLYVGGRDTVAAIAIPARGEAPRVAWQAAVDGTPVNALVSQGKLVVVTDNGNVYCFGDTTASPTAANVAASPKKEPYASPPQGYAWLLGWGDGSRVAKLAAGGQCEVIVFEPDAGKAAQAAAKLAVAGDFGRRVQVIHGQAGTTAVAPYWASLVAVEATGDSVTPDTVLSAALDALRPYTGRLLLPRQDADSLRRILAGRKDYSVNLAGLEVTVQRTAPPAGSDTWTHEAGGAANGYANSEQLVKWPLGVLWYSGDIDRYFTPPFHFQHTRNPSPLVVGGRMFLITGEQLHAIDIYTGNYLWKTDLPVTPWLQTLLLDSRSAGRATERHCVAAADRVYVVVGDKINGYDAATGKLANVLEIPPQLKFTSADYLVREARYQGESAKIQPVPQWTEVRLWNDLLLAMLGRNLAAFDRHTGRLRWTRPSTRQTTTYALSQETLYGLDCDLPKVSDSSKPSGLLFALNPQNGQIVWQKPLGYAPSSKKALDDSHERPWLRPEIPVLAYNAKHGLIVMTASGNKLSVFRQADGMPVWATPGEASKQKSRVYPPVVADDYVVISDYKGCFGFLLDIRTGKELGPNTGIPHPRTCARIIGNNNLLFCRDAATEVYDVASNRSIGLNSIRSGCTTSFIPAEGIVTAPMFGHGCVCNYPMFASLGLYHCPEIEQYRPASVTKSWRNRADEVLAQNPSVNITSAPAKSGAKIEIGKFHLINCTMENTGPGVIVGTKDSNSGYAVQAVEQKLERGVFTFAVQRAPTEKRHGNVCFVFGTSEKPDDWLECWLYYGGRRTMTITGSRVQQVDKKVELPAAGVFFVTVTIDCKERTLLFDVNGTKLTTKITGPFIAISHYGIGGSNSANLLTSLSVR